MQEKKSNYDFRNVNSNFILKKIFDIMNKKKSLLIVKYNKEIQNRLNIATKDYKEYCQIEIELKLVDNKYGKFINISEKDEECYHIYFNDSKEEIKRNYLKEKEKVNTIKIIIDYQVESLKKLFFIVITLVPLILRNLIALI